jgi:hypothetical protein
LDKTQNVLAICPKKTAKRDRKRVIINQQSVTHVLTQKCYRCPDCATPSAFDIPHSAFHIRIPRSRHNFMKQELITKRLFELAGLILIGDGLMGLLRPRRHSLLWHCGPEIAKAVTEELADHPKTSRAIYAAQLALGVALASSQSSDVD